MNGRFIGRWILLIALAFVVASVWFTNNLARQLAAEEQKNVAIWAEATRQLIMADEATDINFFVGRAANPAHQSPDLPINFSTKMQIVYDLSECLKKMGKTIRVSYF